MDVLKKLNELIEWARSVKFDVSKTSCADSSGEPTVIAAQAPVDPIKLILPGVEVYPAQLPDGSVEYRDRSGNLVAVVRPDGTVEDAGGRVIARIVYNPDGALAGVEDLERRQSFAASDSKDVYKPEESEALACMMPDDGAQTQNGAQRFCESAEGVACPEPKPSPEPVQEKPGQIENSGTVETAEAVTAPASEGNSEGVLPESTSGTTEDQIPPGASANGDDVSGAQAADSTAPGEIGGNLVAAGDAARPFSVSPHGSAADAARIWESAIVCMTVEAGGEQDCGIEKTASFTTFGALVAFVKEIPGADHSPESSGAPQQIPMGSCARLDRNDGTADRTGFDPIFSDGFDPRRTGDFDPSPAMDHAISSGELCASGGPKFDGGRVNLGMLSLGGGVFIEEDPFAIACAASDKGCMPPISSAIAMINSGRAGNETRPESRVLPPKPGRESNNEDQSGRQGHGEDDRFAWEMECADEDAQLHS